MGIFLASYMKGIEVGLSNYIKIAFSCYRINQIVKEKRGKNINRIVCIDKDFDYIFKSFFENEELISYKNIDNLEYLELDNINNYIDDKKKYKIVGWRLYISKEDNLNINPFADEWYLRDLKDAIDFRYNNIPEHIQEIYLNIIKKFKIKKILLENVDSFLKNKIIKDTFLGVHIRTWFNNSTFSDNRTALERYNHYLSIRDKLIQSINECEYDTVFMCTDNKTEIQYILDRIHDKNIIFYEYNNDLNSLENDFIELLILSKSTEIYGCLNSTFTELAWWYSNCNKKIKIF